MTDVIDTFDLQPRQIAVYRNYIPLLARRFHRKAVDGLAGRLCLSTGFSAAGAEMALAVAIGGGTFLGIDSSAENLKIAVRNGSCDFMVTTLDEALRILKNELRKQTVVSVGLLGSATEILSQMIARGVQPDLFLDASEASETDPIIDQARSTFVQQGAWDISAHTMEPPQGTAMEVTWTATDAADLKRLDALALEQLQPEDKSRRNWLRQAARYFRHQRPPHRVLGLEPQELSTLQRSFRVAAANGAVRGPVSVRWQDAEGIERTLLLPVEAS